VLICDVPLNMQKDQFVFKKEEVIPCVMTGLKYYPRAKACRETWLKDYEKFYIFSDTPDDAVPITSIPGAGEDWHSHRAKRFFGLKKAFEENPDTRWFFCLSCDNYVFSQNFRPLLDKMIAELPNYPAYLGGDLLRYERLANVEYVSGGAGYLINREAAQILLRNVGLCMTLTESEDVTVGVMMKIAGASSFCIEGFYGCNPMDKNNHCKIHSLENVSKNPITFHYVTEQDIRNIHDGRIEMR